MIVYIIMRKKKSTFPNLHFDRLGPPVTNKNSSQNSKKYNVVYSTNHDRVL